MIDIDVRTLGDRVGEEIAVSDWLEVTQARIDQFADATGDHQWIHVDPARAAAESPFKTHDRARVSDAVAAQHAASATSIRFTGLRMAINYGLNRVRFVSPVPAGSRIRALITLEAVEMRSAADSRSPGRSRSSASGGDKPCVRRRVDRPLLSRTGDLARQRTARPATCARLSSTRVALEHARQPRCPSAPGAMAPGPGSRAPEISSLGPRPPVALD